MRIFGQITERRRQTGRKGSRFVLHGEGKPNLIPVGDNRNLNFYSASNVKNLCSNTERFLSADCFVLFWHKIEKWLVYFPFLSFVLLIIRRPIHVWPSVVSVAFINVTTLAVLTPLITEIFILLTFLLFSFIQIYRFYLFFPLFLQLPTDTNHLIYFNTLFCLEFYLLPFPKPSSLLLISDLSFSCLLFMYVLCWPFASCFIASFFLRMIEMNYPSSFT